MTKIDYSKFLELVIKGIPDLIHVFSPDGTLKFSNKNVYLFDENCLKRNNIKGENRKTDLLFNKALETKRIVNDEKYFPQINAFKDICYNPVLDSSGEVMYIIERQRDITEKKAMAGKLKENESNYRSLVESAAANALIIIVGNSIAYINEVGKKTIGRENEEVVGTNVLKFIHKEYAKTYRRRAKYILKNKIQNSTFEYKIVSECGKVMDVEITSGYFVYNGCTAIRAEIRDITKMKKNLNRAARLQKNNLQSVYPIDSKVCMERIYVPCRTVSGDFYRICKVNEDYAVGIIFDVTGKGMSAALNVFAFDVMFNEAVSISSKPSKIIEILNKKTAEYLDESYIAACCFGMDFKKNKINVVGAGINQFLMQKKGCEVEEVVVEGSPLGMFLESTFSKNTFDMKAGDRFYLFTDGLDFLLDSDRIIQNYISKISIKEFKNFLSEYIDDLVLDFNGLNDDCTMIALEIK